MPLAVPNIVVVSNTHVGSTLALCQKHILDDGGTFLPSPLQKKLWLLWENFWDWTYETLNGEPFILVHNGDVIDGVHHRTTALSTHNLTIQNRLAVDILEQHVGKAERYYQIRGTEAHVGQSAQEEEAIAASLGSEQDQETGQYARWELWMSFGEELIHFAHHIGTTSSTAYESSAPMREMVAAFVEAGQWRQRPPTLLIRSHRHRYIEVKAPNGRIVVTPAWQCRTPFVFKVDRMRAPQFGGLIIRNGSEGVHIREKLYTIQQSPVVKA